MTTALLTHDLTEATTKANSKYALRAVALCVVALVIGGALLLTGFMAQPEPQPTVTVTWDLRTNDGYVEHVSVTGPPDVAERTLRRIVERDNPTEVR